MHIPASLKNRLPSNGFPVILDFAAYLRNGPEAHSDATIQTYLTHLSTFVALVGGEPPVDLPVLVSRATLNRALMQIPRERTSTRRNLVSAVKKLARFLLDMGVLQSGVVDEVLAMRFKFKAKPNRPYLKESELEPTLRRLLEYPYRSELQRVTNLALLGTLVLTGLRNSELCELRLADVDFDLGTITVVRGKGSKRRVIGLPDRLLPMLRLYLRQRPQGPTDHVFLTLAGTPFNRRSLYTRCMRMHRPTGLRISPHRLRRSFATLTNNKGVPIDKIQMAMGHSDFSTTRDYIQTSVHEVAQEMRSW